MAGNQLVKVRVKFINGISPAIMDHLLDDLLEDGVLNDEEKYLVMAPPTTADKARALTNMVINKGHKAAEKMITHLKLMYPELFSNLDLPQQLPDQLLSPSKQDPRQPMATVSANSTEASMSEKRRNESNIYPVTPASRRSRLALMITNIEFDNKNLNRRGAETDEKNMEKLLTSLQYTVKKCCNLSAQEIDKELKEFSRNPCLSETDSVFVVIMSHGILGAILGVHWNATDPAGSRDEFPINNIYKHLNTESCPALLNKPKIIIIQACRGELSGSVIVHDASVGDLISDTPTHMELEDDAFYRAHREKDFISLLSCTPDTLSYRSTTQGSLLIQFLVKIFTEFACEDHIDDLFMKVMRSFEDVDLRDKRQMPTKDRCTLTKHFYLFPGH